MVCRKKGVGCFLRVHLFWCGFERVGILHGNECYAERGIYLIRSGTYTALGDSLYPARQGRCNDVSLLSLDWSVGGGQIFVWALLMPSAPHKTGNIRLSRASFKSLAQSLKLPNLGSTNLSVSSSVPRPNSLPSRRQRLAPLRPSSAPPHSHTKIVLLIRRLQNDTVPPLPALGS